MLLHMKTKNDCLNFALTCYRLCKVAKGKNKVQCLNLSWAWLLEWAAYEDFHKSRKKYTRK